MIGLGSDKKPCRNSTMLMQGIFWMIPYITFYINYKLLNDMSTIDMADDRRWRETDSTSWS